MEKLDIEILREGIEKLRLKLEKKEIERFKNYYCLLRDWNEKINLTGIKGWRDNVIYNFLDSISALSILKVNTNGENSKGIKIIDLGAGAGLPSIPIKILLEGADVHVVDSKNKKCCFLEKVIEKLGLKKIAIFNCRIEELAKKEQFRERYDFGLCRALGSVSFVAELGIPLIKVGGRLILYKGKNYYDDLKLSLKKIKILGAEVECVVKYNLPFTGLFHYLVILFKIKKSDEIYPRRYKTIKRGFIYGN